MVGDERLCNKLPYHARVEEVKDPTPWAMRRFTATHGPVGPQSLGCRGFQIGLLPHPPMTSSNPLAGKALSNLLQGKVAIVTGGNSGIG